MTHFEQQKRYINTVDILPVVISYNKQWIESIVLAVGEVMKALQMSPEILKKYTIKTMPSKSDHWVFAYMAGVRSKRVVTAEKSGFW